MLHFRSHETPTLIHPASRTRDMHTPFEDNLRCMGKKFSRNFLEWENLDFSIVFHIGLLFHTNHKKRHKNQNVTFLQQPRSNEDISHPRNIRHTSLFSPSFLFSPFIYSPLHSNTTDLLFYSNFPIALSRLFRYHTVTNPFIFQSRALYISRSVDTGRRHLITDHRSWREFEGNSRGFRAMLLRACGAQGEGWREWREKEREKKWGKRRKKQKTERRRGGEKRRREEKRTVREHDTVTSGKTERLDLTVVVARGEPLTASTNSTPFPALPPSLRRHLRRSPLHTLFALSSTTPGANATTIPVPPCSYPPLEPCPLSLSFFPYLPPTFFLSVP